MAALIAPRPSSHPFQERQLSLKEPIKVGRAVAKAKATQNNGIFDCRVLSRNHAMLWYENGKVIEFIYKVKNLVTSLKKLIVKPAVI